MSDDKTESHERGDDGAVRPDRATDAMQRPGVAATRPADTPPEAKRYWGLPALAAAAAIAVMLIIVFIAY